jgi:hypothetical protein
LIDTPDSSYTVLRKIIVQYCVRCRRYISNNYALDKWVETIWKRKTCDTFYNCNLEGYIGDTIKDQKDAIKAQAFMEGWQTGYQRCAQIVGHSKGYTTPNAEAEKWFMYDMRTYKKYELKR